MDYYYYLFYKSIASQMDKNWNKKRHDMIFEAFCEKRGK